MTKSIWGTLLGLKLLIAAGLVWFIWLPAHDRDVRERERSDQRAAALGERRRLTDSLEAIRVTDVAAIAARAVADRRIGSRELARADSAGAVADSLTELLAAHLAGDSSVSDTVRALMLSTVRTLETEGASCRVAVTACQRATARLDSIITRRDSSVMAWRDLAAATDSLLQVERRRRAPARKVGLGLACGYSLTSSDGMLRTGPGCAAGVVIRWP